MPTQGKKAKNDEGTFEILKQDGEFDEDEDVEAEFKKLLMVQVEEQQVKKNLELLEKRQRYIRLMNMWVKILDNYSRYLNPNEIKRISEGLYFMRCEDFDGRQLERLESRAINIIRSNTPVFIPNARKMPDSILKVSLIDKRRWVDPQKVHKHDHYGTVNNEIEDKNKFEYLYEKAKELGNKQTQYLNKLAEEK